MNKIKKISLSLAFLVTLSACSNQIRDDNVILDYDWQSDVYNLVIAEVADADNVEFWVRQEPEYSNGSPHYKACVEIAQPTEKNRFYIANLNTYGLTEVKNCNKNYLARANIINPNQSKAYDIDSWQAKAFSDQKWYTSFGISKSITNDSSLMLKFEDLFFVNEARFTSRAQNTLIMLITELQKWPIEKVTVYGIADSSGNYPMNRKLADQRAKVTRSFLIEEGLRNVPITIRGSVENGRKTKQQRVTQRRFMIEVKLKTI